MRAISLFSGAGGFELGFDRAGIETVLQSESDPWCVAVLARHWDQVNRIDDVREVNASAFSRRGRHVAGARRSSDAQQFRPQRRDEVNSPVDLVYGGFPCQDVSVAGQRAGLRGERSGLFYEFARVVRELRPRWFAAENVPGLLSSADGADFGTILGTMVELGYGVAWRILDGRWFGVPQRRRRVLIVGCLGDPRRAAQVLAVCESCGGHSAPRAETGQGVAGSLGAGAHPSGFNGQDAYTNHLIAGTLGSHHGNVRADQAWTGQLLARGLTARQERLAGDSDNFVVAPPLSASDGYYGNSTEAETLIAFSNRGNETAGAQRASDGHHGHSSPRGDGADNLIAFDWQASAGNDDSWRGKGRQHVVRSGNYAGANSATRVDAVAGDFGVRRLTPLECERLMGWPDEHTRWTVDGKEIPDSHRYRMCGNGVIATVAEWLGHRLVRANEFMEVTA